MVSIVDKSDGIEYKGRTFDSIARRIWGQSASVKVGEVIGLPADGINAGFVVRPSGERGSYSVLAHVFLYR